MYQKILSLDFSWPEEMQVAVEAKDLVERLLKLNPDQRLGASKPGSPNDYDSLMKHPYFSGINFDQIDKIKVPLKLPQRVIDENQLDEYEMEDHQNATTSDRSVKEGVLIKRNKWYWKQDRLFILSRDGQLKYFDLDAEQKGTILLTKQTRILKKKAAHFEIINPDRTWYLYSEDKKPEPIIDAWIAALQGVISGL